MAHRLVIAHRGHSAAAPEQTMAAYERAIDLGASMLEVDLRFSRDGVALLLHDFKLDRTTSGLGPVSSLDWSEISRLDAGSWFGAAFAGERVPRLDDVFGLAGARDIRLCIEAKGKAGAENARTVLFAAEQIRRRGRLDRDVVASFDHQSLASAVADFPALKTAPDRLPERGRSTASQLIAQAKAASATIIQHHFADLEPEVVDEVQGAGIEVWAWPPANLSEAQKAVESGAIGLMGDDVAAIVEAIGQTGD